MLLRGQIATISQALNDQARVNVEVLKCISALLKVEDVGEDTPNGKMFDALVKAVSTQLDATSKLIEYLEEKKGEGSQS